MKFKDLHSERIDLVRISKSGLSDMHEYSVKPKFYEFLEFEPFNTIEETEKYLEKLIKRSNSENGFYWFIKNKSEKKHIGTFGLIDINIRKSIAEIGYGLSPNYWGCGYFNETLLLVLRYLFEELEFHKVWAKTPTNNISSIKALEKVGFKNEGILRDFYLSSKGIRYDAAFLSILKEEYLLIANNRK
jgi:[ribosomal protein S5]-alanine N-acetyltransferase